MNGPVTQLDVTMTEGIEDDPVIDPTNWTVRYGGNTWNVASALVTGLICRLTGAAGAANPGADVVSFAPPPFDVITSLSGLPVQAFTDYPIT